MNKILSTVLLSLLLSTANAQNQKLSLVQVIELAKNQSPSAKVAETRKQNRYWFYRLFKSNYNPRLNLDGSLPDYNRDFFQNRLDDGEIAFQSREQISSTLNLGLFQPIAPTGGTISINSRVNRFQNLDSDVRRYNSTLFNVQLDQPLFGFNDLKWDQKTEPLRYEESKRSYVEEMEAISQGATNRYFDYLDAQINLQIAQFNLENNETVFNIEQGRYNIGTTSKDKILQVELQLLRSRQDVTQANLDLQTSELELRSFIGMQTGESGALQLEPPSELPEFGISIEKALLYAKQNRSDYVQFERRRLEAKRDVMRAKSQRFQTDLRASFGLNKAGTTFSESYSDPNDQQRVNVTLSVPILDWGRSKSRIQVALAEQQLEQYLLDQEIQNFEQEIVTLVRRFEVLRSQVEITKKSDEVAQERYNVAQNRYLIGKIDITNLNIALTEKDRAKRDYIQALRSFWTSYFELRRLTLYDFLYDELLYQQED